MPYGQFRSGERTVLGSGQGSNAHLSVARRLARECVYQITTSHTHTPDARASGTALGAKPDSVARWAPMTDASAVARHSPPPSQGHDELNLIDFPISGLQYQQPSDPSGKRPDELVCVIESFDADLNRVIPRKLTRRTSSRHGFPTPLEDEVLVGLLSLTRIQSGFSAPRVEFRNGELFDLMGWPHNGTSNARLGIALDRLTGLSLKYENSWTTEDGSFEKEFTTGLLESYRFVRKTAGKGSAPAERSWVQWASEVFADIRRGNVKELDTGEFYSLTLPLSRRMYRFLDKYLSKAPHFEMDLAMFAGHLGLAETKHIGKIKERLAPAFVELESLSAFLLPATANDRFRKRGPGDWTLHVDRPSATVAEPETKPAEVIPTRRDNVHSAPPSPRGKSTAASELVQEFYRLWADADGHPTTPKECRQAQMLVDRYGAERVRPILPIVIEAMRRQFPDAKAFGASFLYWPEAARTLAAKERRAEQAQSVGRDTRSERERHSEKTVQRFRRLAAWNALPEAERQAVRERVAATASATVRQFIALGKHDDPLVLLACFDEFERRQAA